MQNRTRRPIEFYAALPKVELHRHLEGSVRLRTLVEIARSHGIEMFGTEHLRSLVQVGEDEPYTFENFLSKFATLRLFYRSPEVIGRITREAIEDAANDNIQYLELRFTPVALSRAEGFPLDEVMDWVIEGTEKGEQALGVKTRLITSVNRHESVELAEKVAQLSVDRKDRGIVAMDLAGSEADHSAIPFAGVFKAVKEAGLDICVHAGEWGGPENVREAIEVFGTRRIGHGVRVMEDPAVVELARERKPVFEVCITSNYQSGVVPVDSVHPYAKMLEAGLNATLNTDDPSVSQIVLSNELKLANEDLGVRLGVLKAQTLAAARAACLPPVEREALVAAIEEKYQEVLPEV